MQGTGTVTNFGFFIQRNLRKSGFALVRLEERIISKSTRPFSLKKKCPSQAPQRFPPNCLPPERGRIENDKFVSVKEHLSFPPSLCRYLPRRRNPSQHSGQRLHRGGHPRHQSQSHYHQQGTKHQ